VKERYSAVIKTVTYNKTSGDSPGLTVTLDKVTWNSKYSDGNDEDPVLNPVVKWETVHLGDVLVLVDPGNGFHKLPLADFPEYVKTSVDQAKSMDGFITPFSVYCVGDKPVALVEWYIP